MTSLAERVLGMRPRPPRGADFRAAVSGRIVVITGASRGIGAEAAHRFATAGAQVVLIARSTDALADVAESIRLRGGIAHAFPVDLRDIEATEAVARRILAEVGVPAVVVSNAGHSIHRTIFQYADRAHDVSRTIGVNYVGPVALLRMLIPAMHAAGGGRIIAVSSVSAVVPAPGWSVYGASKSAMDAWLAAVAPEVAPQITVSIVRLPLVRTAMSAATAAYNSAPAMRPIDAVALIARAAVSGSRMLAPWWVRPAAVLLAVWPRALERSLGRHEVRTTAK